MPEQNNPQLKEILTTVEHGVVASTETTKAVKDLELPLEAIAKNTAPKDVQKVEIMGVTVITLKGDKGEPGNVFDDLTAEQKAEIKGNKGDSLKFEDLTEEQKKELTGEDGDDPTEEHLIALITPLIPAAIPGKNGKTPTEKQLLALIAPLIPEEKEEDIAAEDAHINELINAKLPAEESDIEEAQRLIKTVESLPLEERFDYDKLKNLPNLDTFRGGRSSKTYSTRELEDVSMQGIIAGQLLQWDGTKFIPYTPSSSGTNQTFGEIIGTVGSAAFTLAHATVVAGTVRIYRGGAYQQAGAGNDYTIVGASGTLSMVLQQGEVLLADYNWL